MSISAIFGTRLAILPKTMSPVTGGSIAPAKLNGSGGSKLVIECSSRPQKKATAHHRKTRPRKTQPWDIRRGPTVYPPLPQLPPEWSFVTEDDQDAAETSPPLETVEIESSG